MGKLRCLSPPLPRAGSPSLVCLQPSDPLVSAHHHINQEKFPSGRYFLATPTPPLPQPGCTQTDPRPRFFHAVYVPILWDFFNLPPSLMFARFFFFLSPLVPPPHSPPTSETPFALGFSPPQPLVTGVCPFLCRSSTFPPQWPDHRDVYLDFFVSPATR